MFAIGSLTKAFSATADQLRAHVAAQPAGDFRRGQGNAANLGYSLLGQVLASASGQSWDDAVAARLRCALERGHARADEGAIQVVAEVVEVLDGQTR